MNEAVVGEHFLLRVWAGPRTLLHLAPPAHLYPGAAAMGEWTGRTMCGLQWWAIVTHFEEIDLATHCCCESDHIDYVCPVCSNRAATEL